MHPVEIHGLIKHGRIDEQPALAHAGLAAWAFKTALGNRTLWKDELFG